MQENRRVCVRADADQTHTQITRRSDQTQIRRTYFARILVVCSMLVRRSDAHTPHGSSSSDAEHETASSSDAELPTYVFVCLFCLKIIACINECVYSCVYVRVLVLVLVEHEML